MKKSFLKGHALMDEGRSYYNRRGVLTSIWPDDFRHQYARCECGEVFGPGWTQTTIKNLHRQHKDDLRG